MKLPSLSGFGLKNQVFLNNRLNLLESGNLGNLLSDRYQGSEKLKLIIQKLNKDELHLWIKLTNLY
jgi:hypothetical protein